MLRCLRAAIGGALASIAVLACDAPGSRGAHESTEPELATQANPDVATRLAAYEEQRHAELDVTRTRPWSASAGDEPFAIATVDTTSAVGVLRGRDALVLLDADGNERARIAGPEDPVAVAVDAKGWIHALGSRGDIVRVRTDDAAFTTPTRIAVPDVGIARDLIAVPSGLLVTDADAGEIAAVRMIGGAIKGATALAPCGGPIGLAHEAGLAAAVCLFDRGLALVELDEGGTHAVRTGRIVHDGPWWSAAVVPHEDGWIVAGGGVEDHPLDRSDGSFGYVDPHVFVVHVTRCGPALCSRRIAAINVGEWEVVMPKWVGLASRGDTLALTISGYGGERLVQVDVGTDGTVGTPTHRVVAPGLRQLARVGDGWLGANPLLDTWVRIDDEGEVRSVAPAGQHPARDTSVRVGEALFFTTLLAPGADSTGHRSRFTCETCHFEGTVDGRVHYTGRETIHAATKPLLGLFVNRPHFSRALDRTLAVMVDNEFEVANRGSAKGPQFTVSPIVTPWITELGVEAPLDPEALRRAFIDFFVAFEHETSPHVRGRTELTPLEREGAALFATHCETCHQARTVADDPTTRVAADGWAALVLSERGPLVWASETRVRTGIEPYVHPEGARVTSLRRLGLKRPYFTNGSASSLDDVLARVRLQRGSGPGREFAHSRDAHTDDRTDDSAILDAHARRALLAFLVLL